MITIRKGIERGLSESEQERCYHSFSFGEYRDEDHMGFSSIRVLNEMQLEPGGVIDTHPHQNIEILTYVIDGELEQKDSLEKVEKIGTREIQLASAGTGILHSECNSSKKEPVSFWEIWIYPHAKGLAPTVQRLKVDLNENQNELVCAVSSDGRDKSLIINQKATIYFGLLGKDRITQFKPKDDSEIWVQLMSGTLRVNDVELAEKDGASILDEEELSLQALDESTEFMLFECVKSKSDTEGDPS